MSTTIILHGYSDDRASFEPLAAFLAGNGLDTLSIYLGDYISLEDTLTIPDLAKAFATALAARGVETTAGALDLIVHSTGSLIAREWLTRYYLETGLPCPVRRYLMLAPANFGSPLAAMGKTMLGRVIKGWRTNFESGREVLNALEMASPYTRSLARRDLFGASSFYDPKVCMAAVLVGSKPYQSGLRRLADRNGGDGTVYVCTANLNAGGLTARFGRAHDRTRVTYWPVAARPVAFGVFPDRDHGTITRPDQGHADLGRFVLDFLRLASATAYHEYRERCTQLTAATLPDEPRKHIFHTYQNLVAHVTDDLGYAVHDYFLEFYERPRRPAEELKIDSLMMKVHGEVLEKVHAYGPDPSFRSLLFDLTDLRKLLASGRELMFSLSAAPLSRLVSYSAGATNDVSELAVHGGAGDRFWRANQTLLADLEIERTHAPETLQLHRPA